ncbi:MAG: uracil-DNA glycosylase family protein [Bacteroides sp.]
MKTIPIEQHPLKPFLPKHAKVLMLGSFPPPQKRWSTQFFYPNYTNDMWRILGLLFFQDKYYFIDQQNKKFEEEAVIQFCEEVGIAIYDTATQVRRLRDNASDQFLEVVEATDVHALLDQLPACQAIICTGEKATNIVQQQLKIERAPKIRAYTPFTYKDRELRLYRMPSSSRAYPLKVEKKAESYQLVFSKYYSLK